MFTQFPFFWIWIIQQQEISLRAKEDLKLLNFVIPISNVKVKARKISYFFCLDGAIAGMPAEFMIWTQPNMHNHDHKSTFRIHSLRKARLFGVKNLRPMKNAVTLLFYATYILEQAFLSNGVHYHPVTNFTHWMIEWWVSDLKISYF